MNYDVIAAMTDDQFKAFVADEQDRRERANKVAELGILFSCYPHNAIRDIKDEDGKVVITVLASEVVANFTTAAKQADRDQLHGVADRIRNDSWLLEQAKRGVYLKLV